MDDCSKATVSTPWLQVAMAATEAALGHNSRSKSVVEPSARVQVCSFCLRGHVIPGPQSESSHQREKSQFVRTACCGCRPTNSKGV
jgi:hypothetical protein